MVLIIFTVGILTGCGARISTTTIFHQDGSGERTIYATVDKSDEKNITGGFEGLETLLKKNAPSCIKVNQVDSEDGKSVIYQLSYQFSSIEDYDDKMEEITGTKHNAVWNQEKSPFKNSIYYKDEVKTEELIGWAIRAIKEAKITNVSERDWYELESNTVKFNDEVVWTGTEQPYFNIDVTPLLEKAAIYTIYDKEGGFQKQLCLSFSYEDFTTMDTTLGLQRLKEYAQTFKIDENCNGFSASFVTWEEFESFLNKAGSAIGEEELDWEKLDLSYEKDKRYYLYDERENTLFKTKFFVKEVFNIRQLLSEFKMDTDIVEYYINIPEDLPYEKSEMSTRYARTALKNYPISLALDISDNFYMYYDYENKADVTSWKVTYSMDTSFKGMLETLLEVDLNERKLTNDQIQKFFEGKADKIVYTTENDKAKISLVDSFSIGHKKEEGNFKLDWSASEKFYPAKKVYYFMGNYLPEYFLVPHPEEIEYSLVVPQKIKLKDLIINGTKIGNKELKKLKQSGNYVYQWEKSASEENQLSYTMEKTRTIFYLFLGLFLILGAAIIVTICFYYHIAKEEDASLSQTEEI